ncbi:MAG: NADH-quinone oxidoreductase subunit NuoK [Bacteroidia bacterium]|nr:NADH-quinone oxidoreductase subunit NuoK [Bacteroidia bacterium]
MHPLHIFLSLGALLFLLGVFLVLTRRNAVMALMGVELMLNAANLNFVAFSRYDQIDLDGQMAALFVIVLAAAEVAVGLALILNLYRRKHSIDLSDSRELLG